jgi:hypothetical protein
MAHADKSEIGHYCRAKRYKPRMHTRSSACFIKRDTPGTWSKVDESDCAFCARMFPAPEHGLADVAMGRGSVPYRVLYGGEIGIQFSDLEEVHA